MCLILMAWHQHPRFPLVVAANRDEAFSRPTDPLAFWPDAPDLLAGRDGQEGGTWLGITRHGRFAALTNYRAVGTHRPAAPSRGNLVTSFLQGTDNVDAFLSHTAAQGDRYNGFNLFVADPSTLGYVSNRGGPPQCLPAGVYGISNHLLDTPWPKLTAAKRRFAAWLDDLASTEATTGVTMAAPDISALLALLQDDEMAPDTLLPSTGVSLDVERALSSIFVRMPDYGTRSSTVLTMASDGTVVMTEYRFGRAGQTLGMSTETFRIP